MAAYYNEWDSYAAQWLRNLIAAGHLPAGDVDERSITEVQADDLKSYAQCHFFAGIGGWSYALDLAGFPRAREAWTGSCPCQPLSGSGQRKGHADERHLWPAFYALIAERRPPVVFGEQVAGSDGKEWLAAIRSDLEGCGYAIGAADLPARGLGAPHNRSRLFWVANADSKQCKITSRGHAAVRLPSCLQSANPWSNWTSEPAILGVDDGVSDGVGLCHGFGNAIVPQVAAQFIAAYMECRP